MLYHLLAPAHRLFNYLSVRLTLAAITSMLLCIVIGPWLIRKLYAMKVCDNIDREHCPPLKSIHRDKKDTPTMGGLLILTAIIVPSILWMNLINIYTVLIIVTTLWLGVLGAVDDYLKLKHNNTRGLSVKNKLFWQILLGLIVGVTLYALPGKIDTTISKGKGGGFFSNVLAAEKVETKSENEVEAPVRENKVAPDNKFRWPTTLFVPFYKHPVANIGIFYVLFCVLVIVGSSNAVNLTDGLDGLAIGCSIVVATVYLIISYLVGNVKLASYLNIEYIRGSSELVIFLASMVGAGLGFLWYNAHPAQVFMGDTGSLALGGAIGMSALIVKKELLLIIAGGIFVIEALSVIFQVIYFKKTRKRLFLMAPIHHHYEMQGLFETKVTTRFWIVTILFAIISLASLKIQ